MAEKRDIEDLELVLVLHYCEMSWDDHVSTLLTVPGGCSIWIHRELAWCLC